MNTLYQLHNIMKCLTLNTCSHFWVMLLVQYCVQNIYFLKNDILFNIMFSSYAVIGYTFHCSYHQTQIVTVIGMLAWSIFLMTSSKATIWPLAGLTRVWLRWLMKETREETVILNPILINKDINLKIDIQVSIKLFNCYYKKCYKMIVF